MARGYGGFSIEYSNAKRTQEKVEREVNSLSEEEFLKKYWEYDWWRDRKNIYGKYAVARYYKIKQRKYYERNPEARAKEKAEGTRRAIKVFAYFFGIFILENIDIHPGIGLLYSLGIPIVAFIRWIRSFFYRVTSFDDSIDDWENYI